jgi:hypothetical protein
MGERKTLLVVKIMAFIDWLKRQQERSEANRRLFEGRPMVPASEAWGGYQDSPGGQRLMVRQMQRPKVDNTLTIKDDGTRTHVKKWTDVASGQESRDRLRASAYGDVAGSPLTLGPVERFDRAPIAGQSYPGGSYGKALRDVPFDRVSQVDQIRKMIHEQPRSGSSIIRDDRDMRPMGGVNITNLGIPIRAMGNAISRMDRSMQGIRDRIERDRIRRLMQYRTTNPYFPTGGRY